MLQRKKISPFRWSAVLIVLVVSMLRCQIVFPLRIFLFTGSIIHCCSKTSQSTASSAAAAAAAAAAAEAGACVYYIAFKDVSSSFVCSREAEGLSAKATAL
jgi:hypothetical protein